MRLPVSALAAFTLLSAPASAATVSGTVARGHGYTILALSAAGRSSAARLPASGAFSLKVPGPAATLQLVKPNGVYFGPVVLGGAGARAFVRLSPRAGSVGRIALRKGYAAARAPRRAVSRAGAVRARHGAPLGAGRLGLVRVPGARARAAQSGGPPAGADSDGDGVPNTFDADDNGNGTLDAVDPASAATDAGLFSEVQVMLWRSLNANATGISQAQVDEFVRQNSVLDFFEQARDPSVTAVDVDCGTLRYCRTPDGTATTTTGGNTPGIPENTPWPSLDANHDGFPDLPRNAGFSGGGAGGAVYSISVRPNATTADVHAGDLYQVRFTSGAGVTVVPTALDLLFVSSPALAGYDAGGGPQTVSYPAGDDAPGTDPNPIRMTGDRIALSFWRPQRAPIGDEPGYMDMGRLHYGTPMTRPSDNQEFDCPGSYYSGLSGGLTLTASSSDPASQLFPMVDSAADAPPDHSRMLGFTLDLGGCLRAAGVTPTNGIIRIPIEAVDESRPGGVDRTAQTIALCLPGCTVPQGGGPQPG